MARLVESSKRAGTQYRRSGNRLERSSLLCGLAAEKCGNVQVVSRDFVCNFANVLLNLVNHRLRRFVCDRCG